MAIDADQPDLIREALESADSVDARTIDVTSDDEAVVLRGTVATFEEASAAAAIAQQHADAVRNELRVDVNVREGAQPDAGAAGSGGVDLLRGSSHNPAEEPDDLVDDVQSSLDENVPWDPPHEEVQVPTRSESRGAADRTSPGEGAATDPLDDAAGEGGTSLPELSPEELSRAAHPAPRDEEDRLT
jgi:hypothetical protein